ncbi:MAG: flagellar export protein FliJ [Alphaproteobacteria bacterium]
MRNLDGIIRLHRWQVDEKGRKLRELQELADRLNSGIERLVAELRGEQAAAARSVEAHAAYTGYAARNTAQRRNLARSLADIEGEIESARVELAEAHGELKRFEIVQGDRYKRQRLRALRLDQAAADDIALAGYRRRQSTQAP